jgi:hypothetical protein
MPDTRFALMKTQRLRTRNHLLAGELSPQNTKGFQRVLSPFSKLAFLRLVQIRGQPKNCHQTSPQKEKRALFPEPAFKEL